MTHFDGYPEEPLEPKRSFDGGESPPGTTGYEIPPDDTLPDTSLEHPSTGPHPYIDTSCVAGNGEVEPPPEGPPGEDDPYPEDDAGHPVEPSAEAPEPAAAGQPDSENPPPEPGAPNPRGEREAEVLNNFSARASDWSARLRQEGATDAVLDEIAAGIAGQRALYNDEPAVLDEAVSLFAQTVVQSGMPVEVAREVIQNGGMSSPENLAHAVADIAFGTLRIPDAVTFIRDTPDKILADNPDDLEGHSRLKEAFKGELDAHENRILDGAESLPDSEAVRTAAWVAVKKIFHPAEPWHETGDLIRQDGAWEGVPYAERRRIAGEHAHNRMALREAAAPANLDQLMAMPQRTAEVSEHLSEALAEYPAAQAIENMRLATAVELINHYGQVSAAVRLMQDSTRPDDQAAFASGLATQRFPGQGLELAASISDPNIMASVLLNNAWGPLQPEVRDLALNNDDLSFARRSMAPGVAKMQDIISNPTEDPARRVACLAELRRAIDATLAESNGMVALFRDNLSEMRIRYTEEINRLRREFGL